MPRETKCISTQCTGAQTALSYIGVTFLYMHASMVFLSKFFCKIDYTHLLWLYPRAHAHAVKH